jgi:hypothetical protein
VSSSYSRNKNIVVNGFYTGKNGNGKKVILLLNYRLKK